MFGRGRKKQQEQNEPLPGKEPVAAVKNSGKKDPSEKMTRTARRVQLPLEEKTKRGRWLVPLLFLLSVSISWMLLLLNQFGFR